MGDIVAFEEGGENAAGAEGVGLEGNEDEDGGREGVVIDSEVFVEFGNQAAWEVHYGAVAEKIVRIAACRLLYSRCG